MVWAVIQHWHTSQIQLVVPPVQPYDTSPLLHHISCTPPTPNSHGTTKFTIGDIYFSCSFARLTLPYTRYNHWGSMTRSSFVPWTKNLEYQRRGTRYSERLQRRHHNRAWSVAPMARWPCEHGTMAAHFLIVYARRHYVSKRLKLPPLFDQRNCIFEPLQSSNTRCSKLVLPKRSHD